MRSTYLLLVVTGLLFVLGCGECFDATDTNICLTTPATSCDAGTARRPNELIISLKPGIDFIDLKNPIPDTMFVCANDEDALSDVELPIYSSEEELQEEQGDCPNVRYVFTGKDALKAELERLLFNDTVTIAGEIQVIDECNCGLALLSFTWPENVDINNGVAGGTTKAKKQDNGMLGSIGFNYNIVPGPIAATPLPKFEKDTNCYEYFYHDSTPISQGQAEKAMSNSTSKCKKMLVDLSEIQNSLPNPTEPAVKVAVIDTGVDPFFNYLPSNSNGTIFNPAYNISLAEFNDLTANSVSVPANYGGTISGNGSDDNNSCLEDDFYGYDYFHRNNNPADAQGHGTHIAGTIMTAQADGTSQVRIMPLQFGGFATEGDAGTAFSCNLFAGICAIDYATRNGADIINLSWGYYSSEINGPLARQLGIARDSNILVVASTGNDGVSIDTCMHWPSNFSDTFPQNFIAVAALDTLDASGNFPIASYSNTGNYADLAAPGTMVKNAALGTGSGEIQLSGTSMAAAVISRRAAMLMYPTGQSVKLPAEIVKQLIMAETIENKAICTKSNRAYDHQKDTTLLPAIY